MRYLLLALLTGCGFHDPRHPSLSEDNKIQILLKAQQTANWSPWCDGYPSAENCNDGDNMAGILGFGCAVGFKPSCDAVSRSVIDGQLHRSPNRHDTDNTASRDQLLGFFAAQLSKELRYLEVKRFIKEHGKICLDDTDNRCELTPVTWAIVGAVHKHLGYTRDLTMTFNGLLLGKTLLAQSVGVPLGYQLNLVVNAAWIAHKTHFEDDLTYAAAYNAYLRQQANPWFCIVVKGADDECAALALQTWPAEPDRKLDWSIQRDTAEAAYRHSEGWEYLFLSGLFGVDLNRLDYRGKRYSKGSLQPQQAE